MLRLTFLADGVIFPGKTIIPLEMFFSSRILKSLPEVRELQSEFIQICRVYTLSHGFDTHTTFVGEKNEDLVRGVVPVIGEEI